VAGVLGMTVRRLRRRMSNRELLTWLAWLESRWDTPGPREWYLMQVACEVRRVLSKKPEKIQPHHFKLRFRRDGQAPPADPREAAARSKSRWLAAVGVAPREG
jgi:hypothetical protein